MPEPQFYEAIDQEIEELFARMTVKAKLLARLGHARQDIVAVLRKVLDEAEREKP